MNLLTKTGYYYLAISFFLFLTGGIVFYLYISSLLDEEINEQLDIAKKRTLSYVREYHALPATSTLDSYTLTFIPVTYSVQESVIDTLLLSPLLDEQLPYRRIIFPVDISGSHYAAIMHQPLIEKDDLLQAILKSLAWSTLILVVIMFFVSRWLSYTLWKPFNKTLHQLKGAGIQDTPHFPPIPITEFNALHEELNRLFQRIQTQYKSLKEFSENASHELQTPLAIIRNNLESFLQYESLTTVERTKVRETYESTNRLSRILQSLLLLSKIENLQFVNVHALPMRDLLDAGMRPFKEILAFKNLTVELHAKPDTMIHMDPYLAEVMLSNLLGNAFRHCPNDGTVRVECSDHTLTISNSGPPLDIPAERLFDRFAKGNVSIESTGLGLALVKQISDLNNFQLTYSYQSGYHKFVVLF
ncbi:MAG: HAMP domain-containing histidine kinase [Saprospiraceae bacterium]|nr:HAMP domain-containing histidine kinase [Candidatus Opimibacter iunctus]